MEDRQRQIREGAGLEESRLNTEFIEFLRKYSTPMLLVIAAVAGGYGGLKYLEKQRDLARDNAFVELESAVASRSVKTLASVADENGSRGAVAPLARLDAADLHLASYRTGLPPGIQLQPDGATGNFKLPEGEKYLTEEERGTQLTEAAALYKLVIEDTDKEPSRALLTIGALDGLASVAESRGQFDEAKAQYQKLIDKAKEAGYPTIAAATQKRIDSLDAIKTLPKLYAQADLPQVAAAPGGAAKPGMVRVKAGDNGELMLAPDPSSPDRVLPVGNDGSKPGASPTPPAPASPQTPQTAPGAPAETKPAPAPAKPDPAKPN